MTGAVITIDLAAIEPSALLAQLGNPEHRLTGDRLTIEGVDQATADAALANYQQPLPTAEQIDAERWRRVMAWLGVMTRFDAEALLQDGNRRAMELMNDRLLDGKTWTQAETDEAAMLRVMAAHATALRQAADALKAAPVLSYQDDAHWPVAPGGV